MFKNLKRKFAKIALTAMALQLAVMGLGTGATGTYAAADSTPPTANVFHDGTSNTITYSFSEAVELRNNDDTSAVLTPDKLGIFRVVAGNYDLTTKTANTILSAEQNADSTKIAIVYDGSLVTTANTDYVVDAWGYKITDLDGNQVLPDPLQIFTVNGDNIAPTATVAHDEVTKTIKYTFSEPVALRNNDDSPADLTSDKLGIFRVVAGNYDLTTKAANTILSAELNADSTKIAITYDGTLVKNADTDYVVDAWGYKITDIAGNRMLPDLAQVFTVLGDTVAPTVKMTSKPVIVNDVKKSIVVTFTGDENIAPKVATNVKFVQGLVTYTGTAVQTSPSVLTVTIPADTFTVGTTPIDVTATFVDGVLNETAFTGQISVDTMAPAAVTGLTTFTDAAGHVRLSWINPNVGTYTTLRVVRDGVTTIVLDPSDTTYYDMTTVFGGTYKYVVIVGDSAGNETTTPQVTVDVPAQVVAAAVSDSTDYTAPADEEIVKEEVKADTTEQEDTADDDNGFPVWGIVLLLILAAVGGYLIWNQKPAPVVAPVESKKKNTSSKKK